MASTDSRKAAAVDAESGGPRFAPALLQTTRPRPSVMNGGSGNVAGEGEQGGAAKSAAGEVMAEGSSV